MPRGKPQTAPTFSDTPPPGTVAAKLMAMAEAAPALELEDMPVSPAHGEYRMVPVHALYPDPDNPRKVFRYIRELADSLGQVGMLEPIVARVDPKGKFIILYGHRRHQAAILAGWKEVPTIIRTDVKDAGVLARQLVENSHREDLDPMDEARALRRYMLDQKIATFQKAADTLGHHLGWVTNRVALLDLSDEDQEAVSAGTLSIVKGAQKAHKLKGRDRASKNRPASRNGEVMITGPMYHFDSAHPLASRARAMKIRHRCDPLPGGVACGECWEQVIRADERSAVTGEEAETA